jgi:hypothetical protein
MNQSILTRDQHSITAMTHIDVCLDTHGMRRWHQRLLERLSERADRIVTVTATPAANAAPAQAELLFSLETMVHGLPRPGPATRVEAKIAARHLFDNPGRPDRVIDLAGAVDLEGGHVWRLEFDGVAGERGLLAAILAGRAPIATLRDGFGVIAIGRLGSERPGIALAAFEDCLVRVTSLILAALDGSASRRLPDEASGVPLLGLELGGAQIGKIAAKALVGRLIRRLYHLCHFAPHWRVGWRAIQGPDVIDLRRHHDQGWTNLPDDGRRFYADPFPIQREGVVTLFVEEFDHRLGRGVISAAAFGPKGLLGPLEPVLDLPYHLSYPVVFEADGETWMIPESCAAGTIDLYRATKFPSGWVREATLVKDIVASDATIVQHDGRWWMFATVRDDAGGAFSDCLHLWSAPDFRGPWTAHARNPVLIDIASARPAGRMVTRGGALIRPVQDCEKGYGHALSLARVTKLDDEGFEQTIEATLHAGPAWPGRRLHTLNSAGGYEFIDGSAHARRPALDIFGRPAAR